MNIPSKDKTLGWRLILAGRPPKETANEKVETAKWLIRVVPSVNAREQYEIWDILSADANSPHFNLPPMQMMIQLSRLA